METRFNGWIVPVAIVCGVLGGFFIGQAVRPGTVRAPAVVECPSEDSCTADYRNGAWHIEVK